MAVIKHLCGYSGSQVLLMKEGQTTFVRKFGQNDRNLERLDALNDLGIALPKVLSRSSDHYDMEYVRHTDMIGWLSHNAVDGFVRWLLDVVKKFDATSVEKDYLPTYIDRLNNPALSPFIPHLPFNPHELIDRLPRYLPAGQYHGDMTMDNCLHGIDGRFYLIDPLTSDYDGWVFDIAKLMQDLECGWFIRDKNVMLKGKLWAIRSMLISEHPIVGDQNLLILMLLRILPYARSKEDERFLISEMQRLWMS